MAELLAFTVWSVSCRSRAGASWAIRQNNTFVLHSCNGGDLIISPTLTGVRDCYSSSTKLIFHWFCLLFYLAQEGLVCAENSHYSATACSGDQWTPNDHSAQKIFSVPWPTTLVYIESNDFLRKLSFSPSKETNWHQRFEDSSEQPCRRVSLRCW